VFEIGERLARLIMTLGLATILVGGIVRILIVVLMGGQR